MKITKIISLLLISGTLLFANSCKKCGYCRVTCYLGSSGGGTQVTDSDVVCSGDGGVNYAYDNAKNDCIQGSAGVCSTEWINK